MSNNDKPPESLALSPADRARLEADEQQRVLDLAQEVSRRYDPERLGKLSVAAAGRAEKLDDDTRRRMESRLGGDFRDVRVVRGAFADRVTRHHGADAVTVGATGLILVRDTPRANPRSPEGRALLAHGLTYVKQAQRGMHFALEQGSSGHAHEQVARQVEGEELAREKALPGPAGQPRIAAGVDPERRTQRVIDRVLEMFERVRRDARDRRGFSDG